VDRSWKRIMALLAEQDPDRARVIRPPAPATRLLRLEAVVGRAFPAALLLWWSTMDGVDDHRDFGGNRDGGLVPESYMPLGVARAEEEYLRQSKFADPDCCTPEMTHRKQAGDTGFPFCTALVPFCRAVDGCLLCVDLRQGDNRGLVMEWAPSEGFFPYRWAGLPELLAESIDRLENP